MVLMTSCHTEALEQVIGFPFKKVVSLVKT